MGDITETVNHKAFESILGYSYEVDLPMAGVKIQCRPLPFTTFVDAMAQLVLLSQEDNKDATETMAKLAKDLTGAANSDMDPVVLAETTTSAATALIAFPTIVTRVLKDIVVNSTDAVLNALTITDIAAIIAEVLEREDKAVLAEKLSSIFTQAAGITQLAQMKSPSVAQSDQSDSPSQDS